MHHTLHAPSGTTVIYSWTRVGYDAVAFLSDGSRASLVDDVNSPQSLWLTARWIVETSGLGSVDDLGAVLVVLLFGPELGGVETEQQDELVRLVESLGRLHP